MNESPFPGMDPFLEDSTEWSSFHSKLINSLSDALADLVSPHFSVRMEQRVYLVSEDEQRRGQIEPDLYLIQNPVQQQLSPTASVISPSVIVKPLYDLEMRDRYIEIRDKRDRTLVTTIELLSPFNKAVGTTGRRAFMEKRQNVMASDTHWLEIDLLRGGERPHEVAHKSDYYALLRRAGIWGEYEVWYFDLRDPMPTIAVPLRPPFPDVPLNLQSVFTDAYVRAHYADDLPYTGAIPAPTLRPAVLLWAREQVNTWLAKRNISTA